MPYNTAKVIRYILWLHNYLVIRLLRRLNTGFNGLKLQILSYLLTIRALQVPVLQVTSI